MSWAGLLLSSWMVWGVVLREIPWGLSTWVISIVGGLSSSLVSLISKVAKLPSGRMVWLAWTVMVAVVKSRSKMAAPAKNVVFSGR